MAKAGARKHRRGWRVVSDVGWLPLFAPREQSLSDGDTLYAQRGLCVVRAGT
jgi:hypothetical protein